MTRRGPLSTNELVVSFGSDNSKLSDPGQERLKVGLVAGAAKQNADGRLLIVRTQSEVGRCVGVFPRVRNQSELL